MFINSSSFSISINREINNNRKLSFEHAIIHEIGYHLYDTHELKDKVKQFYNDKEKQIKEYFKYVNYKNDFKNEKDFREFFADYFCKFRCGELDHLKKEIYHFISNEYELLKGVKNGN